MQQVKWERGQYDAKRKGGGRCCLGMAKRKQKERALRTVVGLERCNSCWRLLFFSGAMNLACSGVVCHCAGGGREGAERNHNRQGELGRVRREREGERRRRKGKGGKYGARYERIREGAAGKVRFGEGKNIKASLWAFVMAAKYGPGRPRPTGRSKKKGKVRATGLQANQRRGPHTARHVWWPPFARSQGRSGATGRI